jgi:hypothetical protein
MSHLKSIGIDVGVIAKGLSHRLDEHAKELPYSPVSLGNWGLCGCSGGIDNVQEGLDTLAQLRATTITEMNVIQDRMDVVESSQGLGDDAYNDFLSGLE